MSTSAETVGVFDWLKTMRSTQPVHRDEQGVWQLFNYEDVHTALFDAARFRSNISDLAPRPPEVERFRAGNVVNMDDPKHRRLRGLIVDVFTPRVVDGLTPRITGIINEMLDAVDGAGRFDIVESLTHPLPVIVIAELLGVPASDRPLFRSWADALLQSVTTEGRILPTDEQLAAFVPPMVEMGEYLGEYARARRANPADDMISRLANAEVNGVRLTDDEVVGFAVILLLAGHITTTATLGNAVWCLDQFPAAADEIRANPALLPAALEEVLRYRPPFPRVVRATTTEVALPGGTIPANQLVALWLASANHDPARFPDPEKFDIHRPTTGHVTFGHGIHFCIGSRLARLEARLSLEILFQRYRRFAVDPDDTVEFRNPWSMNSVSRLPLQVA